MVKVTEVIAVVLIVIVVYVGFNLITAKSDKKAELELEVKLLQEATIESQKVALLNQKKLHLPETLSESIVSETEFPEELRFLIPYGAKNLSFKETSYPNNKGYNVDFLLNNDLYNTQKSQKFSIRNNQGWEVLKATRTEFVSVIEVQNAQYQAQILFTSLDNNTTEGMIEIKERWQ